MSGETAALVRTVAFGVTLLLAGLMLLTNSSQSPVYATDFLAALLSLVLGLVTVVLGIKRSRTTIWRNSHQRNNPPIGPQSATPSQVTFVIKGLPPGVKATVVINGVRYEGSDVIVVNTYGAWEAQTVFFQGDVYSPNPEKGYVQPGSTVHIYYYLRMSSPQPVKFVVSGLPQGAKARVKINNRDLYFEGYTEVSEFGKFVVKGVYVGGTLYVGNPTSGYANPGDVIRITYTPWTRGGWKLAPTPSRPTFPTQPLPSLQNWDPNVWVGKKLDVYRVTEVIGEGGMSYVLKGEFENGAVAIKVLKVFGGKAEDYFDELFKEASNLTTLSESQNIVKVIAVTVNKQVIEAILNGQTRLYLTNPPMIVMEFMEGGSMYSLVKDDTFFYSSAWQKAVYKAIASVAEALDSIHAKGYVHMDVKPQNVFMDRKPRQPGDLLSVNFKLGDLGSAVRAWSAPIQLTPEYSPPESLTETARPYMDVFALGMTLYVLLTRKNDRPDLQEMNDALDCYVKGDIACVARKVSEVKAKLTNWSPSVNPEVDPLLRKMLSSDPLHRPSAKEVADYLKRLY